MKWEVVKLVVEVKTLEVRRRDFKSPLGLPYGSEVSVSYR